MAEPTYLRDLKPFKQLNRPGHGTIKLTGVEGDIVAILFHKAGLAPSGPKRFVTRDEMIGHVYDIWRGRPADPVNSLHQHMFNLKRKLPSDVIFHTRRHGWCFDPQQSIWVYATIPKTLGVRR